MESIDSGTPALLPRLTWAQELPTADGKPYLRRWVADFGFCSLRLHHWLCSDDDRAPHDHPYWMITLVLRGGYDDMQFRPHRSTARTADCRSADRGSIPLEGVRRRAPSVAFWHATHTHYVRVHEGGCWSICLTGRQSRIWGFWQLRGDGVRRWVRSSRYFRRVGAHACDR